jgi:hypothetical protein
MAFPADRFTTTPTNTALPLRLPSSLATPPPPPETVPVGPTGSAPLVLSANGVDPVNLAVEFTRTVPASGNLAVCGQQFWLGPTRAGTTIAFWADATVVHLLRDGVRLKTVPSRLTTAHLKQLLAAGAHRPDHHHPSPARSDPARPSRSTAPSPPTE